MKILDNIKTNNEADAKKGILYLCLSMQGFQAIYCFLIGIYYESAFCFISFLFQLIIFRILKSNKELAYHLTCLNSILVILSGNIHDALNVNATFIFFSLPPLICIPLVGIKWGAIWSGVSITLSTTLMGIGKHYYYGWGKRAEELSFDIGLSNLVSVPLLVFGIFGYFYHKKQIAEQELTKLNNKLADEKAEKEKLLTIVLHDIGRNTSLLSSYIELAGDKKLSELELSKITSHTNEIKNILQNANNYEGFVEYSSSNQSKSYDVFQSLKKIYENELSAKKISFVYEGSEELVYKINRNHLQAHIISNFLSNAIKFSNQNTIIRFIAKEKNIKVINQGLEFSSEQRNGTSGETGSGVGLEIVKEYCRKSNIKYNIYSEKEKTIAELQF